MHRNRNVGKVEVSLIKTKINEKKKSKIVLNKDNINSKNSVNKFHGFPFCVHSFVMCAKLNSLNAFKD